MTPRPRTPQLRDKRFARVRRVTQTILVGSGVASGLFIGYAASTAKPLKVIPPPVTTPTTTIATATTTPPSSDDSGASTPTPAASTPPVTAPITSTTTCYSTPSGTRVCY
ncbi:MAG TPA: hypothetical protein VFN54_01330 [Acidimicrobiales bacterium]|nr:hypothetical protein [Acidimicrobiales bacterium]